MLRATAVVLILFSLALRLLWQAELPTPIDLNLIGTLGGVALLLVALAAPASRTR